METFFDLKVSARKKFFTITSIVFRHVISRYEAISGLEINNTK